MKRCLASAFVLISTLALADGVPPLVVKSGQTQQLRAADTLQLRNITGATQCVHADSSGNLTGTGSDCSSGSGTVTTAGAPVAGELTKFSGATSITNGDISGDCTTAGTLAITCLKTNGSAFAASATTDTTNATNISSGLLGVARGGTGADLAATGGTSRFLKQAGTGAAITVVQPACGDLSNAAPSCSTDATNAANISSGTIPTARLPIGSASQVGVVKVDGTTITASGGVISSTAGIQLAGSFFNPLAMQRMTYWVTNSGAATFFALGDTITAYGTAGGSGGTTHVGISLNSSGTASGYRGVSNFLVNASVGAYWLYGEDGTANVRYWMALASGTSMGSATPTGSYIGFRYDTSASDAHWQCASSDGSAQTLVDTGVSPDATQNLHSFAALPNAGGTSVDFYIEGSKVCTISTHLPSSATGLRNIYEATALTATVRVVLFGTSYVFQDAKR